MFLEIRDLQIGDPYLPSSPKTNTQDSRRILLTGPAAAAVTAGGGGFGCGDLGVSQKKVGRIAPGTVLGAAVVPFYPLFWLGGFPTKIDCRKKGTRILTSLREALGTIPNSGIRISRTI